jgi:hypothetical protein
MNEYYSVNDEGFHRFYDPISGLEVLINDNTGTVNYVENQEFYTKPLLVEDAIELVEFMQLPGSGLGMLMIKLGRAFGRAVGAGSDAK